MRNGLDDRIFDLQRENEGLKKRLKIKDAALNRVFQYVQSARRSGNKYFSITLGGDTVELIEVSLKEGE